VNRLQDADGIVIIDLPCDLDLLHRGPMHCLVVAVTAGLLTSPSPLQLFAFDLPSELVSRFPLVLVPVFLVPVSVLLHLASLTKLRRNALCDNDSREIARVAA
jgi:hypothetical protein